MSYVKFLKSLNKHVMSYFHIKYEENKTKKGETECKRCENNLIFMSNIFITIMFLKRI